MFTLQLSPGSTVSGWILSSLSSSLPLKHRDDKLLLINLLTNAGASLVSNRFFLRELWIL